MTEKIDQIRRAWQSAQVNPGTNPAAANLHKDLGDVLNYVETLTEERDFYLIEAQKLIRLLRDVGDATNWRDREQTDRVFAWYEFDGLREALGEGGGWGDCPHENTAEITTDVWVCEDCGETSHGISFEDRK